MKTIRKRLITLLLCAAMLAGLLPMQSYAAEAFADVDSGQYYYEPVLWAIGQEPQITTGTSADRFSPDATCTRGQIVTFLYRSMK